MVLDRNLFPRRVQTLFRNHKRNHVPLGVKIGSMENIGLPVTENRRVNENIPRAKERIGIFVKQA
jgi:hypothetical protein|tara:strand:- start:57 stop:251 length:195 start_codon:yes stop_codon:yes gene_type:complete